MNEFELSKNAQLSEFVVQNLNKNPKFPFPDNSFDVVTCVVSVDYLIKPLEIFQEVSRVLRPGGRFIISQSNRFALPQCSNSLSTTCAGVSPARQSESG